MRVYRPLLQTFFEQELPSLEELADALTFHAFEIEDLENDGFEVNLLPDRAAYALSHRGIAKEISGILNIPMKHDPLQNELKAYPQTEKLEVTIDERYVLRHKGALVSGVKVGPSPSWLVEYLEALGQRSINNVVDASNFVMMNMGQPTHAFDAGKLKRDGEVIRIDIREGKHGEKLTLLTEEEVELGENIFTIADATSGEALDVAGVKGGLNSGVSENTTDLFVSAGNYDGTLLRKAAQKLKIFTDASLRFQNRPSPDLVAYGMQDVLDLIIEVAGGEVVGIVDVYPTKHENKPVRVSTREINELLGSSFTDADVTGVFDRLEFSYAKEGDIFSVLAPFERKDIAIREDLVEEVGRMLGYDRLDDSKLPTWDGEVDQAKYRGIERIKDVLVDEGFVEISTQSFAVEGDVKLANPLDTTHPFMRTDLFRNMQVSLDKALHNAPVVGGTGSDIRLFEIGTVFPSENEEKLMLIIGFRSSRNYSESQLEEPKRSLGRLQINFNSEKYRPRRNLTKGQYHEIERNLLDENNLIELGRGYEPLQYELSAYTHFSQYPFVLRDVAVWVPESVSAETLESMIREKATDLLVRIDQFDEFAKDGRVSYAFHLVFQSNKKTLSDDEVGKIMDAVTANLSSQEDFEVR